MEPHLGESAVDLTASQESGGPKKGAYPAVSLEYTELRGDPDARKQYLEAAYDSYVRNFPIAEERIGRELFFKYSSSPEKPNNFHIVALSDGKVVGSSMFVIRETESGLKFGMAVYTWVEPEFREMGIGKTLVQQRANIMSAKGCSIAFCEINDPNLMSAEEKLLDAAGGLPSEDRIQLWNKIGYQWFNAPYAMPGIDGQGPVLFLGLAVVPLVDGRQAITGEEYKAVLKAWFAGFIENLETDATYLQLIAQISDAEQYGSIPLVEKRKFGLIDPIM